MFVHIIPKSRLRHPQGVFTYRSQQRLLKGQLVIVTLRGRKIPGIVQKSKDSAGTSAYILPVKKVGQLVLPHPYLQLINQVATYYTVNLARSFYLLAPYINTSYISDKSNISERNITANKLAPQKLAVTPSNQTALYTSLLRQYQIIPISAAKKRDFWLNIATGKQIAALGNIAAASLPFTNLKEVIIDSPFASSYASERSPAINAVQIAFIQADFHKAKVTVRSSLPADMIKEYFTVDSKLTVICPPPKKITVVPNSSGYNLNDNMVADIKDKVTHFGKVLIYENVLNHLNEDGVQYGLEKTAAEVAQKTGIPTSVAHHSSKNIDTPITIATSSVLYTSSQKYNYTYILNIDSLVSATRIKSAPEAIETIGILASRTPLTVQTKDQSGWLALLCSQKLKFNDAIKSKIPRIKQRIIIFKHKAIHQDEDIAVQIQQLWPKAIINISKDAATISCLSSEDLSPNQSKLILTLPSSWTAETRASTLPKTS